VGGGDKYGLGEAHVGTCAKGYHELESTAGLGALVQKETMSLKGLGECAEANVEGVEEGGAIKTWQPSVVLTGIHMAVIVLIVI
jgi:hypothetical protein